MGRLRCQKQIASNFTNSLIEFLLVMADTTECEAQAQAKQLRSQYRAQNSSLDDAILVVLDQNHEHDNFDNGTKGCLQEDSNDFV